MRELLLMYYISDNKKIRDRHQYETSSRITLEDESTIYADATINTGSSAGRILIVDDDPDITLSFSIGLEDSGFEVYTYNDPLDALLKEIDLNVKICFITAGEINIDGLREVYSRLSTGCFISKPISISDLVKRLKAELA